MSNLPPDVIGNATPHTLLTRDEMLVLEEYYRAVSGCSNDEKRKDALKGWSERQRKSAVSIRDRLRHCGFFISGQSESGSLFFGYRLKSEVQQVMELSEENYRLFKAGKIAFCDGVLRMVKVSNAEQA